MAMCQRFFIIKQFQMNRALIIRSVTSLSDARDKTRLFLKFFFKNASFLKKSG